MAFEDDKFADNIVARYEHWTTFLHPSQCYLGRSYVALNRKGDELDIYRDTTPAEKYELDIAVNGIQVALTKLWHPDWFNHADFRNEWKHCHLHIIPRYESERVVNGEQFTDANYGHNYAPYRTDFEISGQTLEIIRSSLREELRTF